ncbi:hypothetical protein RUND412_010016 [Rhizina undulata]
MAAPGLSAKDLKAFDFAAAGHDGVLSDKSGSLVIKPCTPDEVAFYTTSLAHPRFRSLMPTFLGTLELSSESTPTPENEAKPHNRDTSIVLSNITLPFLRPCVLDIKLGAQLWDSGASLEKRKRLDDVAYATTSGSLGFRIAGMKVWKLDATAEEREDGEEGGYRVYDKLYGRAFNKDTVIEGLKEYFDSGIPKERVPLLAKRFLEKVREVRDVLEHEESRMYSASLLFVYEGDGEAFEAALKREEEDIEKAKEKAALKAEKNGEEDEEEEEEDDDEDDEGQVKRKVDDLKLIDFAHATWTPGEGPDENALQGVRSVEALLKEIAGEA